MFADAEALVREFLDDRIPEKVRTKTDETLPSVRVWRTGGAAANRVLDRPIITVTARAADSVAAAELANRCRSLLLNAYSEMPLVRFALEVSGLYYDPDPDDGTDRYTFAHQLNVRATF